MTQIKKLNNGYSIVQLVVVIVVIGILASITTISYSGWRKSLVEKVLKNDLTMAKSAMENDRNFNNSYTRFINTVFTPSKDVSIDGGAYENDKSKLFLKAISGNQSYSIDQDGTIKSEKAPVLYLDANKPLSFLNSGQFWNDISGNGNNCQFINTATAEGFYPGSDNTNKVWDIKFNSDNRASTTFTQSGDSATWEIWVKYTKVGTAGFVNTFLSLGSMKFNFSNNGSTTLALSGSVRIGTIINPRVFTVTNTKFSTLSPGDWNHLVFSVNYNSSNNTTTPKLYINGVSSLTTNPVIAGKPVYDSNNLIIGGTTNSFFDGLISNVKIFNSALTDSEVTQEYNLLKYRYKSLELPEEFVL